MIHDKSDLRRRAEAVRDEVWAALSPVERGIARVAWAGFHGDVCRRRGLARLPITEAGTLLRAYYMASLALALTHGIRADAACAVAQTEAGAAFQVETDALSPQSWRLLAFP